MQAATPSFHSYHRLVPKASGPDSGDVTGTTPLPAAFAAWRA